MASTRIDRLAAELKENSVDVFFACTPSSMGYLHGLHESGGERFFVMGISPQGKVVLIAPALAEAQARRVGVADIRAWKDGEDPAPLFEALADEWGLRSGIIAVDDEMPAHLLLRMQASLPAALFRTGKPLLSPLMARKEPEEIALMKRAGAIADEAFQVVLPQIKVGMTERQVDKLLRDAMSERGGEPAFCIVATGAGSAEPHHLSGEDVISENDVLILDFGCDVEGYKSDITRTVCVGANAEASKVYEIVFHAHRAAREAAIYGATGQDVDRAARKVIEDAGYGPHFFHRTGHGIGSQLHEEPNMVEGNDSLLVEGNAFSVEPGIYLEGKFGVRIENIVAMGVDGCESLNDEPSPTLIHL
jgi:Xaa-Pro aminopeptidase